MKLRLSLLAPVPVFVAVFLTLTSRTQTFVNQASAQSTPETASPSMQQDSQPASLASSLNKGEQKLTGCIRSDNGKYVVETKLHKKVWLSGADDFAPHVGHTVILYGTYLNGSAPAKGVRTEQKQKKSQESPPDRQENNFQVSKIEMLSDTCAINKAKASDRP
jgi:hypothetical protein